MLPRFSILPINWEPTISLLFSNLLLTAVILVMHSNLLSTAASRKYQRRTFLPIDVRIETSSISDALIFFCISDFWFLIYYTYTKLFSCFFGENPISKISRMAKLPLPARNTKSEEVLPKRAPAVTVKSKSRCFQNKQGDWLFVRLSDRN